MAMPSRRTLSACSLFGALWFFVLGFSPVPLLAVEPTPEQDDAAINGLSFLGPRTGWAVGDRGTVWKTADGGENWLMVPCPVTTHWNSVCFLTDRIGWLAGGHTVPYSQHNVGFLLSTTDGGQTWTTLVRETWPRFHVVRFFDLENGVAACDSSTLCPSGLLTTSDGGKTWTPIPGSSRGGWRAASFTSATSGVVCGLRGEQGYVGETGLQQSPLSQYGLRGLLGCSVDAGGRGWLVGDGATVQRTDNGGVSWTSPAATLPRSLKETLGFRAVAHRGERVWIAGTPGSVIYHSDDGGQSWRTQATGNSLPLRSLTFVSDRHGFAAGDLGRIIRTEDGGETWTACRGGDRRVALLFLNARPDHVPYGLATRTAGEQGYRVASYVFNRQDIGAETGEDTFSDERAADAFLTAGGAGTSVDWRLPVTLPELSERRERLVEEWSLLTEQKLGSAILSGLVATIRTWRPDVIVLDESAPTDYPAALLFEAARRAIPMAADGTRYPEHLDAAGLQPWKATRVLARAAAPSLAAVQVDPHEVLPRLERTVGAAAASSLAILHGQPPALAREQFVLVRLGPSGAGDAPAEQGLFTGLDLRPGGPARRALPPLTGSGERFEQLAKVAQKQRHLDGYFRHLAGNPQQADALLAQLPDVLDKLPPAEAALQLANLARRARTDRDWPLAERTYLLLVDLFPDQPVTREALDWLLTAWISEEFAWQRSRTANVTRRGQLTVDAGQQNQNLKESTEFLKTPRTPEELELFVRRQKSAVTIEPAAAELRQGDGRSVLNAAATAVDKSLQGGAQAAPRDLERQQWEQQSTRLQGLLEKFSPAYANDPGMQFALAAHWRRVRQHGKADHIYDGYLKHSSRDPWHRAALGEVWLAHPTTLSPKPVGACRRLPAPPVLDGDLADECWSFAARIPLVSEAEAARGETFVGSQAAASDKRGIGGPGSVRSPETAPAAMMQLGYDDRYLYLAGRFRRVAGLPEELPSPAGRTHDEDLATFDRISVSIDTDRDYRTSYRFDIDQRGRTRDVCWEDSGWDPRWHLAVGGDETEWRFEAAIPIEELVSGKPGPGTIWAVGLVRTLPAVGFEAWTHPAGDNPMPAAFGLLRFE